MAQLTINIGAAPNDGTGDTLRDGGDKINDNFTELYGAIDNDPNYSASVTAEIAAAVADALATGPETIIVALGDEITNISTGVAKITFYAPFTGTIVDAFIGLTAQSTSGVVTADLNNAGASVFSTNPTIGANVDTSLSGAGSVDAVIGTSAMVKGDKYTVDIDAAGTGAKGLKMYINVSRT